MAVQLGLSLLFACRGGTGRVLVHYGTIEDPAMLGFDLLDVGVELTQVIGFPAVRAEVSFDREGYHSYFGWVQTISRTDSMSGAVLAEVDLPQFLEGDGLPMLAFGYLPSFYDAPANPHHPDGSWQASTFLVAIPDLARSRVLEPVAGFGWGYQLAGGKPTPLPLAALGDDAWNEARRLLTDAFPFWSFGSGSFPSESPISGR